MGQRRAIRRRDRRIGRNVRDFQALTNIKVVLNKIKNRLEVTNVDKRRRIGVLVKPYKDRTVTHRIELVHNEQKQEWEVVEIGNVVARNLGRKTLYFIEQEKK
jgi:hypothetical protein